jgi:hypothetical protein
MSQCLMAEATATARNCPALICAVEEGRLSNITSSEDRTHC